jgi:hypothetical protein
MAKAGEFERPSAKRRAIEGLNERIAARFVTLTGTLRPNRFVIDQLLNCSACP